MGTSSQQITATLRNMIIYGELRPGERVAEIPMSERLGVSRTPIRLAFRTLTQEGLLRRTGARGLMVRDVSLAEIEDAVEVRGVLEGLAARLVAERGMSRSAKTTLENCLRKGDEIFGGADLDLASVETYHEMNRAFHTTVVEACGSPAIQEALSRIDHLPFASPNSIAIDLDNAHAETLRFHFAHREHHIIFDAICHGQGGRAEAAMREHAKSALRADRLFDERELRGSSIQVVQNSRD